MLHVLSVGARMQGWPGNCWSLFEVLQVFKVLYNSTTAVVDRLAGLMLQICGAATIIGRMSCSYLEHAEAIIYPQAPHHLAAYKPGGRVETFQIEELVREGARG